MARVSKGAVVKRLLSPISVTKSHPEGDAACRRTARIHSVVFRRNDVAKPLELNFALIFQADVSELFSYVLF